MAASELPSGLELDVVGGDARPIDEWLMNFQMLAVVLDPYTHESAWILETASRVLENFKGSSLRVGWIVTATEDDAKAFLGPYAERFITFLDPDRTLVAAAELDELPALVNVRQDRSLVDGVAEGWQPHEWKEIADAVAEDRHWSSLLIPGSSDPSPYRGSAARD